MTQPIGGFRSSRSDELTSPPPAPCPGMRPPSAPPPHVPAPGGWEPPLPAHALRRPPADGGAPAPARVATAATDAAAAPSLGANLVFDKTRGAYVLSDSARAALQPLFQRFGFDLSRTAVTMVPAWRAGGKRNAAYTIGDSVTVNRDVWAALDDRNRLALLAHEITHSVQYDRVGKVSFLARYAVQYFQDGNYQIPPDLGAIPIESVDPLDRRFTLDQIAQRFASEIVPQP